MFDILVLVAIFAYWFVAIWFYGILKFDGRLGQAACVVGSALWPVVAIISTFLALYGALRRSTT